YFLSKFELNPALLILPLVLGELLERSLLQTAILSRGSVAYLLERPVAVGLLVLTVALILVPPILGLLQIRLPGTSVTTEATGAEEGDRAFARRGEEG
ncbi:MAG: hypothetical protein M3121_03410, partial [Chloroflexota bacterium]|nr:hypothetical protein [Chloroflexota bacterium]